jgi:PAS domain S-box-containing protein
MDAFTDVRDTLAWLSIGLVAGLLVSQLLNSRRYARRLGFLQQQFAALRVRHQRMLSICRRMRTATWTLAPEGGAMTWDGSSVGGAGAGPGATTLDHWLERIAEGNRSTLLTALRRCATEGRRIDLRVPVADEPGLRLHVIAERGIDHDGRPGIEGVCIEEPARASAEPGTTELQEIVDLLPLPLWITDTGGHLRQVNRAWLELCPDTTPEQAGDWLAKVHPDDLSRWMQGLAAAIVHGESFVEELRLRTADAGMQWHMVEAVPIRDAAGRIAAWSHVAINVDERRRAADAHLATTQRLTGMLESMADGLLLVDANWRVVFANRAAEQLLALKRETLGGAVLWNVAKGLRSSPFERELRRAGTQRRGAVHDQRYRPTGRILELRALPAENGLAIHLRDVTDSRSRDSQLRLLEHAVARLNDMILITDAEGTPETGPHIVFVNDTFAHRTGYAAAELAGKTTAMFLCDETRPETVREILQAMSTWSHLRTEVALKGRNDEVLWVELDLLPLSDESGWHTHWVAVLRDVTERRRMNQQMLSMNRIEAIGQIAAGMAHDFNNLLTVILGNGDMLAEQVADRPQAARHLEGILTAADRGAALTRRLLALARRQALSPVRVDVTRLLADLMPLLGNIVGEHIELHCDPQASLGAVFVDPAELETAIVNLCVNARDAMAHGGQLRIEAADEHVTEERWALRESMPRGRYLRLTVADSGEGIPQALIDRVADPFFTTKGRGRSGLGLATVHGFMRQSGGYMLIESAPGEGTRVHLYLPQGEPLTAAITTGASSAPAPGIEHHRARILLVEDDAELRRLATEQLRRLGYDVHPAATGQAALDLLPQIDGIDLLFTDMVMPGGISGAQLAQQVRSNYPDVRVLFTSGYTEGSAFPPIQDGTPEALLVKPYRTTDLAQKIAQALA